MAFRDSWHRTLVYFGLAEDRDAYDDDDELDAREPEASSRTATASGPTSAASSSRRRRDEIDDIFADDARPSGARPCCGRSAADRAGQRQRPRRRASACTS